MLYQKLLMGSKPYFTCVGNAAAFVAHRHPEVEISYCLEGSYTILCENKRYLLSAGDFLVIPAMAAHALPAGNDPCCRSMTVELGYAFLGGHFEAFIRQYNTCRVYQRAQLRDMPFYREFSALMEETARLCGSYSEHGELTVKGNLYKMSALLLQGASGDKTAQSPSKKTSDLVKIEKALEIIHNRFYEPLSIGEVSAACGYSKSNFCKIFKTVTGDTFHNTLNRHRIEIACTLLRESDSTVERIAQEIGFADTKSFCRVFKKLTGKSAGAYRKTQ